MPYKDKQKRIAYKKKWNKEYYAINHKNECERVKERKQSIRRWFSEYKKLLSCSKCGETHIACLEFHHKDGERKEFGISRIVNYGYSKKRIEVEIAKCKVLCSNCHRKLHAEGDT